MLWHLQRKSTIQELGIIIVNQGVRIWTKMFNKCYKEFLWWWVIISLVTKPWTQSTLNVVAIIKIANIVPYKFSWLKHLSNSLNRGKHSTILAYKAPTEELRSSQNLIVSRVQTLKLQWKSFKLKQQHPKNASSFSLSYSSAVGVWTLRTRWNGDYF